VSLGVAITIVHHQRHRRPWRRVLHSPSSIRPVEELGGQSVETPLVVVFAKGVYDETLNRREADGGGGRRRGGRRVGEEMRVPTFDIERFRFLFGCRRGFMVWRLEKRPPWPMGRFSEGSPRLRGIVHFTTDDHLILIHNVMSFNKKYSSTQFNTVNDNLTERT
ncbi:hypothetical protein V8G54_034713, partial [Vigna mungo]